MYGTTCIKTMFSINSQNTKVGYGIANIYYSVPETCSSSCPLKDNGCYAQKGRIPMLFKKYAKNYDVAYVIQEVSKTKSGIVRLNVSGDFFLNNQFNYKYFTTLLEEIKKYPNVLFYGYTRACFELEDYVKQFPDNLKLIVSLNDSDDNELKEYINNKLGLNYSIVVDNIDDYKLLNNEKICPIDFVKFKTKMNRKLKKVLKNKTTCKECKLCITGNKNIVFQKV